MSATAHENDAPDDRGGTPSSVAVTDTPYGEAADASKDRVPDTTPVAGSIASPGGRPDADQVRVSPSGSEPARARVTVAPSASVRLPGGWTSGGRLVSATTQANDTSSDRVGMPSSAARTVTQ